MPHYLSTSERLTTCLHQNASLLVYIRTPRYLSTSERLTICLHQNASLLSTSERLAPVYIRTLRYLSTSCFLPQKVLLLVCIRFCYLFTSNGFATCQHLNASLLVCIRFCYLSTSNAFATCLRKKALLLVNIRRLCCLSTSEGLLLYTSGFATCKYQKACYLSTSGFATCQN